MKKKNEKYTVISVTRNEKKNVFSVTRKYTVTM